MSEPWVKIPLEKYSELNRAAKKVNGAPDGNGANTRSTRHDGGIARLRVKSVQDDHLVCRTWDGTTEGTYDIKVAKPPTLRKTPYHGKTITFNGSALTFSYSNGFTRTVTKGTSTETQIIVPAYTGTGAGYGGEEIYAEYCPTGLLIGGEVVGLVDKNIDGRQWAKQ